MSEQLEADLERIRRSPFFDAGWYLNRNADVAEMQADPALHFLEHGAREGRDPGPFFDTKAYAELWPEVQRGQINALVHFMRWVEGDSVDNPDATLIAQSALFDVEYYLRTNTDVAAAGMDPLGHFLNFSASEGRDPGPRFSTRAYLERRPDVATAGTNPLVHFLRHGIVEDRVAAAELANIPFSTIAASTLAVTTATATAAPLPVARRKLGRKAVFVTHDFNIGGAPKLLQSVASWFQRCTDYDVHIVAMATGPFLDDFKAFAPVHVVGHMSIANSDVPVLRDALRAFLGEEPAFTFINSAAAGHYCKIDPFNAPTFGYVHELTQVLDLYRDQFDTLMGRAQHVFCGASAVYDAVIQAYPDRAEQLSTRPSFIPNPDVDQLLLPTDKVERRRQLGFDPDRKLVMACGVAHWRKQPLVFVRTAARLIRDRGLAVEFAWVGDGEDVPQMRILAEELGIADRLHLLGHRTDLRTLFAAADLFALTSSEDPFPLVCLEAGALSAPVVAFREATGFADVIEVQGEDFGGAAVPLNDEEAFAEAVATLLTDEAVWTRAATAIRRRVNAGFIEDRACMELLLRIREVAGLPPRVSVVVPSYNSAPYLAERLESIAAQTFRDVELLLLDDASSDESPQILKAFAHDRIEARVLLAEKNGGSVFRAWERGIHAAAGDFVWIAEADDYCEPTFLERMLQAFAPSGTRLVHGRSIPVNLSSETVGDWNDLYLDAIVPGLWRSSFWSPAAREIGRSLGRANTIPNASGVLVRRAAALEAIKAAASFKLAGDWAFYVAAVHGGRIAYCHEAVNYHRRHTMSVTATVEGSDNYFRELASVGAIVRALYGPDEDRDAAFRRHLEGEARRFSYTQPLPAGEVPGDLAPRAPGVLMGVGDLSGGGAQMFAVRFVNKWTKLPGAAVLFVAGHEAEHPAVRTKLSPLVPVIGPADIDAEGGLAAFLRSYGLDAVLTGHWWADQAISHYKDAEVVPQPWAIVMHGCHESVLGAAEHFPGYRDTLARAERHCAAWIWTAPKNRQLFEEGHVTPRRTGHIVNGFEPVAPSGVGRAQLGLSEDAIVFTLASRAIPEKGWHVALEAFQRLRAEWAGRRDIRLQLIGDGPVAEELRRGPVVEGLHSVPHTARLADYIHVSDICLLPSWFAGESLPLVLIEFLAQGKPAIVSDIGMCAWAIDSDAAEGGAGFVVPRDGPGKSVQVATLAAAMERFITDPSLAASLEPQALAAARKFDLTQMISHYRALFEELIAEEAHRLA